MCLNYEIVLVSISIHLFACPNTFLSVNFTFLFRDTIHCNENNCSDAQYHCLRFKVAK